MQVLRKIQEKILKIFVTLTDSNSFYLTGGTALANFYLKHRRSDDIDFFTSTEEIIQPFSFQLEESLKKETYQVERFRSVGSFVELQAKKKEETTIIHLALDTPFRFEKPKIFKEFPNLKVDSFIDIATNKILALFGRATLRDFIDIYFLIKEKHFTLEELIRKAKIKDPGVDNYWLNVSFKRIDSFNKDSPGLHLLLKPCSIEELQDFFHSQIKKFFKEL